jgi:hypothetical protein
MDHAADRASRTRRVEGTRPQAVQSVTGVYYIAVVTALTAEIAVNTRLFPA